MPRGNGPLSSALLTAVLTLAAVRPAAAGASTQPVFQHVVLVLEENTNFASVIGSPAAPYFNKLATTYALATGYYADTHPSIGNYFWLTTGQDLTDDDSQTPSSFPVDADNIVRRLIAAGASWKAYAECLPSVGYTGGNATCANGDNYYVRHVPLAYMADVQQSAAQRNNLVPFEDARVGFAADLANGALPAYSFVTPDGCHDGHDCDLSVVDGWLHQNIGPLIDNPPLMRTTLVIVTFDESGSDNTNGGGKVYWVAVGSQVNAAYTSANLYQHQSTLRQSLEGLGLPFDLGAAATAPGMAEFFKSFGKGARVVATTAVEALKEPRPHAQAVCAEAAGSTGTLGAGPRDRDGAIFWRVAYDDGCEGWTLQASLALD